VIIRLELWTRGGEGERRQWFFTGQGGVEVSGGSPAFSSLPNDQMAVCRSAAAWAGIIRNLFIPHSPGTREPVVLSN
jgi:hypothetical protein